MATKTGYKPTFYFSTRSAALREAAKLRKRGIRARVASEKTAKGWCVWTKVLS